MSVLARIPMDGTFDQVAPLDRLTGLNLRKGFALTLRVPLIDGRSRSNGASPPQFRLSTGTIAAITPRSSVG